MSSVRPQVGQWSDAKTTSARAEHADRLGEVTRPDVWVTNQHPAAAVVGTTTGRWERDFTPGRRWTMRKRVSDE